MSSSSAAPTPVSAGMQLPMRSSTAASRNNTIRSTVSYFIFTLFFAVKVLNRMGGEIVHQFNSFIAGGLGLVSISVQKG
jgi:hypothetical protein